MHSTTAALALLTLLLGCSRTASPSSTGHWEQLSSERAASSTTAQEKPATPAASTVSTSSRIALPVPSVSSRGDIPKTMNLAVPFTSQAPHANWDDPYQEACEEASLLMVHQFLQGKTGALPPDEADKDLVALIRWQERSGYGQDVTIGELAAIAETYYGYTPIIEETVTVERIKELVAQGYPVIVPAAGRDLGNPYFSGEGPWYHMLVIRGYDRNEFITNDPGTRRGEGYEYPYDVLIAAIHDWTGVKEEIRSGSKRMLILKK